MANQISTSSTHSNRIKRITSYVFATLAALLTVRTHAVVAAPMPPTDLTATVQASYRVLLNWSDQSDNESVFRIERQSGNQGFEVVAEVGANISQYLDTQLRAGVEYAYRVQAVDEAGVVSAYSATAVGTTTRLNVLFIIVDDLRPELSTYGVQAIQTPNIDRLAEQGMKFTRAYTQMATCSPSRTSLMTGLRPDTARVTDLQTHFRDTIPSVVTLPEHFKENGYSTHGICKVYHNDLNDEQSWSIPWIDRWGTFLPKGPDGKRPAYAAIDAPMNHFTDRRCANSAVRALEDLKDEPFFLAVGFKKPHLPFVAPTQYFDMYDPNAIPEAVNPFRADGAPDFAFDNMGELRNYSMIPPAGQAYSASLRRELKRGYYAATSFVDDQVGRVMAALRRHGLEDDTLVVLVSDHGWHLGEQAVWGKHTNFEVGTRVPLIFRVPGQPPRQTTRAIVELVDLYPTICELAGLPIPNAQQHGGYALEGESFADLMDHPLSPSKRGAISLWGRNGYVGHSIRTDRYRFTEWVKANKPKVYELYDHVIDPSETVNIASDPDYAFIIPDLQTALAARGQQDLPPSLLPDMTHLGQQFSVEIDHDWRFVESGTGFVDEVVIAGPPSYNGKNPGIVRLREVSSSGFEIRFQEWPYLHRNLGNFWHVQENVSYIALPPGRHDMADGSVWEVGTFELGGTQVWQRVSFNETFPSTPYLFLSVQTENDPQAVSVRARAISPEGFGAALFNEEAFINNHGAETVGYVAILNPTSTGHFQLADIEFPYMVQSLSVNHRWEPVLNRRIKIEEERSRDSETSHVYETVHVLTFGDAFFAQQVSSNGQDTTALRRDN